MSEKPTCKQCGELQAERDRLVAKLRVVGEILEPDDRLAYVRVVAKLRRFVGIPLSTTPSELEGG